MIKFDFCLVHQYVDWLEDKYHNDLANEGHFTISIDDKLYFEDPYFLIDEFLRCIHAWSSQIKDKDMLYNCIDTCENPLISFVYISDDKWQIRSPWQKFQCNQFFAKKELTEAVTDLIGRMQKVVQDGSTGQRQDKGTEVRPDRADSGHRTGDGTKPLKK